jgi:protoporphyrinogen oxidase
MGDSPSVHFHADGRVESLAGERIISTIPLNQVIDYMEPAVPEAIKEKTRLLRYLDIIFIYLIFNKERISDDSWLYFPTGDIIFNRAVEFKNWTPYMCPEEKTALCLDVTCQEGDTLWNRTDQSIIEECIEGVEKAGLGKRNEVIDHHVVRVKYAYPVYSLGYKENLIRVVRYLERDGHFHALGRTGMFRYNNADNSMEMGLALAKAIIRNDRKFSLLDYELKDPSV